MNRFSPPSLAHLMLERLAAAASSYGAFSAPSFDVVRGVAEIAHDLLGMLTEPGCERADRTRRVGKFDRDADLLHLRAVGRGDLNHHVARADLRIVLELGEREH